MIVVVGMAFEARIAAGLGTSVICSGDGRTLADTLERTIAAGRCGLVSFGIAGGLAAGLRPGDCVVASEIVDGEKRIATDRAWSQRLLQTNPDAVYGPLAGVVAPVASAQAKHALHRDTGAVVVDMESHVVARAAAAHGLPMIAIRVVADPAERALPRAALVGARPDGTTNAPAVFRALLKRPHDIPALMRLALDVRAARGALLRGRELLLSPGVALADVGELKLDVA